MVDEKSSDSVKLVPIVKIEPGETIFTSSGVFTVPKGVKEIKVFCVGGYWNGAYLNSSHNQASGGAGGGGNGETSNGYSIKAATNGGYGTGGGGAYKFTYGGSGIAIIRWGY